MKGHLSRIFPLLEPVSMPISRDQAYILFIILNELLLGLETYLAHSLNGTLRFNEWIPVISGPFCAFLLLVALVITRRRPAVALVVATAVCFYSILVGVLGTYFHFVRAIRPFAAPGERVSLALLVWGAPVLAPPAFVLAGVLGLVALSGNKEVRGAMGLSLVNGLSTRVKDTAYFFLASAGVLLATVSSVFDHLRGGFENPWLWVPTLTGIFGVVVAFTLGVLKEPRRYDMMVYACAMGVLLLVGPLGLVLHVLFDLGVGGTVIFERFLRRAPILAPMVFANFGLLGLLALLDPHPSGTVNMHLRAIFHRQKR